MSTDRDYLAAGLALGGLSDAELAEAQALADSDPDFRSEVAAYEDTMALMAESDAELFTAADAPDSAPDDAVEPVSAATRDAILSIPETHSQAEPEQSEPEQSESGQVEPEQSESGQASPGPGADRQSSPEHDSAGRETTGSASPPPPADLAEHRRQRQPWVAWVAAAAAVIVVGVIGVNSWQLQQNQSEMEEKLASTQQQLEDSTRLMEAGDLRTSTADLPEGGEVTVFSSENEQLIRLNSSDVDTAPAGKSLQMWVIGDEGPESVGLMTEQPVTIADEPFGSGSLFGITVEPEGGSEQPTTDPIVAIDL
ncbi:anti-sigma factor [Brevibacterium marinum]|uniref:Anti-sigma-K factor RskA n=1 Tax=Brevibacterium marinum TaxID=418643 RepID=A0A846RXZ7_9MICO|nr:anti-sigma factor [Brevibacterium marinum]NJC55758.1 anti-sigma-K factor RskA [Brevibacterium marinum]